MSAKRSVKILIVFFIIIFLATSGYLTTSIITNTSSVAQVTRYKIIEYNNGTSTETLTTDKNITSSLNFTLIGTTTQIYALGGSSFDYANQSIRLSSGTIFVSGKNMNFYLGNNQITIENDFKVIIDKEDGIILAEGTPAYKTNIQELNTQITLVNNEILTYEFDREKLTSEDKYKNMQSFLSELEVLPEYFSDMSPPELVSISPSDGFITTDRYIRMFGYTEGNSKVEIAGEAISSDAEGYFTKQIDLQIGANPINIVLKDKYGNKVLKTVVYTRKASTALSPTSYPTSYPASYTN